MVIGWGANLFRVQKRIAVKRFFDTSILLYACDLDAGPK
jgi:hypothetical protein